MKTVDLTLSTPEHNLACDETLLEWSESSHSDGILRFWEPRDFFVVLGYGNQMGREVNIAACRESGIPILRRVSGGGTVLQGPGCLNYSLVLKIESAPELAGIGEANAWIMNRQRAVLETLLNQPVSIQGTTDLTVGNLKCSGNAQRRLKTHLLFHGTFLLNMDLKRVESALSMPSRQPDYRQGRPHGQFLTNIKIQAADLKQELMRAWNVIEPLKDVPWDLITRLVDEKYSRREWNEKF